MAARSAADKPPSLKAAAVRLLARRDFGRAELRLRLARRGGEPDEIERVLDDLERAGYLSDTRYAQAVVAQKAGHYGRRAIAHSLKEKGVAPAAAADAMRALAAVDELAAASALWQRRFGAPPRDAREKARQVRFLMARGFPASLALKVLRAAGASIGDDDDGESAS